MNRILSTLGILAVAAPAMAFASEATYSYPRLPGDASNSQVEYAPGDRSNVVGGGIAVFTGTNDQRPEFAYGRLARQSAPGVGSPRFVGVDDGRPVFAYSPAGQSGLAVAGGGSTGSRRG